MAFIGDIVLSETFPNADPAKGGDAQRLAEVLNALIQTFPPDTVFVAAHGKTLTMSGLRDYLEMVEETSAAVKKEIDAGNGLDAVLKARPLAAWARWESATVGPSIESWTTEVYASYSSSTITSICEPVTEALVNEGIDAAEQRYRRLKKMEADDWDFAEGQLNFLGYQLLQRSMVDEAISMFRLNVESYPESANPYDSLGEAYMVTGENDLAVANYERSLELDPSNENAEAVLKQLRDD